MLGGRHSGEKYKISSLLRWPPLCPSAPMRAKMRRGQLLLLWLLTSCWISVRRPEKREGTFVPWLPRSPLGQTQPTREKQKMSRQNTLLPQFLSSLFNLFGMKQARAMGRKYLSRCTVCSLSCQIDPARGIWSVLSIFRQISILYSADVYFLCTSSLSVMPLSLIPEFSLSPSGACTLQTHVYKWADQSEQCFPAIVETCERYAWM